MSKYFYILILFCFSAVQLYGQESVNPNLANDNCVICHKEMDYMPDNYSNLDIHMREGVSCSGCHGGDPTSADEEKAMSRAKGFVGAPGITDIPKFCGKCHSSIEYMRTYRPRIATDQVTQYYTSVHGMRLKKGDTNVATCVSCHSSHSILPATDTRSTVHAFNIPATCNTCHGDAALMSKYGISSDQYKDYSQSVHGKALLEDRDIGAPSCNDCHGNHGATPPNVESISHVCGTCHVNNMNYFQASVMAEPFEDMEFHACEQCHGNHLIKKTNDNMVGVGEESLCTDCHSKGDAGYENAEAIYSNLHNLSSLYDSAKTKSVDVKVKGMNDIDIEFKLKDAHQSLIQARTLVHTFDTVKVKAKTDEGAADAEEALKLANIEIDEYFTRRYGYGIATIIFLVLAVALYLKIKGLGKD